MPVRGTIQYVDSPQMEHRAFLRAVKAANEAAVEHWWHRYVPNHFTVAGGRKYGYQPRRGELQGPIVSGKRGRSIVNRRYYWQKFRKTGSRDPLVYSGNARRAATSSIRITGTIKGARGVMSMPKYFYQYRKDLKTPDKAAELVAITQDEVTELARFHAAKVDELMSVRRNERGGLTVT